MILLKKMPFSWLTLFLNEKNTAPNETPHVAINLFDLLKDNTWAINKIISCLKINDEIAEGNTILHYYIFKDYSGYKNNLGHKDKKIILSLLNAGYDYNLKNDKGNCPYDYLQHQNYFKEHIIIKKYQKISKLLKDKNTSKEIVKI